MTCAFGISYIVQEGDTLFIIAERKLGDGNRWTEIKNPDGTAPSPTQLQPGQELCLPGAPPMATLFPGQYLGPGQSVQSDNKLHTLIMQSDGNVVLYNRRSQAIWSTKTGGLITPGKFIMQTDGNLVLYDSDGNPGWASNTYNNPGAFLNVQDDGNLVVYRRVLKLRLRITLYGHRAATI